MAIKFRKLIMLSILFPLGLGTGLSSGEVNVLSTPTKEAISYASSDDLNDHDTNHSSDYSWTSFSDPDGGTLSGGTDESDMKYYYLDQDITFTSTSSLLSINGYVTLCLNGKTLDASTNVSVTTSTFTLGSNTYFNLCDCSGNDSGTITGLSSSYGVVYIYNGHKSTFNMYGGTITGNTASEGGGVVVETDNTFNMYGGSITGNTASYGGGVSVDRGGAFNMYGGTISNNTATRRGGGVYIYSFGHGTSVNMYGGYFDNDMYNNGGTISIKGGYFSSDAYSDIDNTWLASDYQFIDISLIGSDLDENYLDGYPYAAYATSTTSYSVSDVTDITYGSTYTPTINTDSSEYTSVAYTYKDGDNEILGLPTEIGEYTVTAHFLYTTTEGYITNNSYGTAEFKVTILSSSSTSSDGEDGTDNNSSDDGTTTSTDSTGLSAGAIAGIVIACVFVVGLIVFLVYFFVFRKKKAKKEEKKSSKKTKK